VQSDAKSAIANEKIKFYSGAMKSTAVSTLFWFLAALPCSSSQSTQEAATTTTTALPLNLGFLQMEMTSLGKSATNVLLKNLLSSTYGFLDAHFAQADTSGTFQKVNCAVYSYQFDNVDDSSNIKKYYANVTLSAEAVYLLTDVVVQAPLLQDFANALTMEAFAGDSTNFLDVLSVNTDPFLSNILTARVKVNGAAVVDTGGADNGIEAASRSAAHKWHLELWMIALVAGAGAFLLVFCCIVAFICCIKVDDQTKVEHQSATPATDHTKMVVQTKTSNTHEGDGDDLEGKTPSPQRSITSQDSSAFTYNPRSQRSNASTKFSGSYFTHNSGIEMDVAAWEKGSSVKSGQLPFGHDISAIEDVKNLSLIEEESQSDAGLQNSNSINSRTKETLREKESLFALSSGSGISGISAQQLLTEAAVQDMEREERSTYSIHSRPSDESEMSVKKMKDLLPKRQDSTDSAESSDRHVDDALFIATQNEWNAKIDTRDDEGSSDDSFLGPEPKITTPGSTPISSRNNSSMDDSANLDASLHLILPPPLLNRSSVVRTRIKASDVLSDLNELRDEIDTFRHGRRNV
jgi:hypothetical protein